METKVNKKRNVGVVFKNYDQNQMVKVPIYVGDLVGKNHLVRVINDVVDKLDLEKLSEFYKAGGCPSFHPKMLIKVWIYGYCEKIYTSRPLEKAMRENINMIWLSGNQHPCFKTLCEFRGNRMRGIVDMVFEEVLLMLIESGYIDFEDLYVDGSKWEANGNKHQVVWKKNTLRYKEQAVARIKDLLKTVRELQKEEDGRYGYGNLAEVGEGKDVTVILNSAFVSEQICKLNNLLEAKDTERAKKRELLKLSNALVKDGEKLKKYEAQEKLLQDRNSYSKTDSDATVHQMKDGQLLPSYNIQHTTQNQYILNYGVFQQASDSPTLIPHWKKLKERLLRIFVAPNQMSVCADAGYGSEENYAYLEGEKVAAYVKYQLWYREVTGVLAKSVYRRENWKFIAEENVYICPNGRELVYKEDQIDRSTNGYDRKVQIYESKSCEGCPVAGDCKKSEDKARTVRHSSENERLKKEAKELLSSAKGEEMRSQRGIEVETVFGDLKYNMRHRRFILRGLEKVSIEYGLLAIAHNLRKVSCEQTGIWKDARARRVSKKKKKSKKAA
jgi:transposase